MNYEFNLGNILSLVCGLILFTIGVLNLFLVHPVPGFAFILLSLLYLPQTNAACSKWFGFQIPLSFKFILFIVLIWFTLGVSDLGDIID